MLARALCLCLLVLPLGCARPTEPRPDGTAAPRLAPEIGVVFRAERVEYRHGDTAAIVLRNSTGQPLGYNLCFSAREIRTGDAWRRIEPLRICTAALYGLAPGDQTVLEEPITAEWRPGEYRMVTTVELMRTGRRGEVFTAPFSVTP